MCVGACRCTIRLFGVCKHCVDDSKLWSFSSTNCFECPARLIRRLFHVNSCNCLRRLYFEIIYHRTAIVVRSTLIDKLRKLFGPQLYFACSAPLVQHRRREAAVVISHIPWLWSSSCSAQCDFHFKTSSNRTTFGCAAFCQKIDGYNGLVFSRDVWICREVMRGSFCSAFVPPWYLAGLAYIIKLFSSAVLIESLNLL